MNFRDSIINKIPQEIYDWLGEKKPGEFWEQCERPDWFVGVLLNMTATPGWPSSKKIVAACLDVLYLVTPLDRDHQEALKTISMWVKGETVSGSKRVTESLQKMAVEGARTLSAHTNALAQTLVFIETANIVSLCCAIEGATLAFAGDKVFYEVCKGKVCDILRRKLSMEP